MTVRIRHGNAVGNRLRDAGDERSCASPELPGRLFPFGDLGSVKGSYAVSVRIRHVDRVSRRLLPCKACRVRCRHPIRGRVGSLRNRLRDAGDERSCASPELPGRLFPFGDLGSVKGSYAVSVRIRHVDRVSRRLLPCKACRVRCRHPIRGRVGSLRNRSARSVGDRHVTGRRSSLSCRGLDLAELVPKLLREPVKTFDCYVK